MNDRRPVRRQTLALIGMAVAMIATLATSPAPPPQAMNSSGGQQIHVSRGHSLASQLFVVSIPAAGAVGLASNRATVSVDMVVARDAAGNNVVGDQAVVVRVVPVDPKAPAGFTAAVTPAPTNAVAPMTVSPGSFQTIELGCEAPGPCDRAYRVIVTLRSDAAEATVTWSVSSVITWDSADAYPSPATGPAIRVEAPVELERAAPVLDVATAPETVRLGATAPALARLVELRYTPTPRMTYVPVETLTVDVTPVAPTPNNRIATDVKVVTPPTDATSGTPAGTATGTALGPKDNPFAGCAAGESCTKTLLVSLAWAQGDPSSYEWSVTAHRTDLDRALSEPPSVVSIKVLESFSPSTQGGASLHYQGDLTVPSDVTTASMMLCVPEPTLTGTSVAQPYRDLLPIPVSVEYWFSVTGRSLNSYELYISFRRPDASYVDLGNLSGLRPGTIDAGPFAGRPAGGCVVVEFGDRYGNYVWPSPSPGATPEVSVLHWSLDAVVYSYSGLTYTIERRPAPPNP